MWDDDCGDNWQVVSLVLLALECDCRAVGYGYFGDNYRVAGVVFGCFVVGLGNYV